MEEKHRQGVAEDRRKTKKYFETEENRLEIKVQGDQIESAIKSLKRQLIKDGILKELKNRRAYEKPSIKKKRKQREARRRRQKAARRQMR